MKNWMPPPPSPEEVADCNRYVDQAMKYTITEALQGGCEVRNEHGHLMHFDEIMQALTFVHNRVKYERN